MSLRRWTLCFAALLAAAAPGAGFVAEQEQGDAVESEAIDLDLQAARDAAFIEELLTQTALSGRDTVFAEESFGAASGASAVASADAGAEVDAGIAASDEAPAAAMFVEVGAEAGETSVSASDLEKVHAYCEICVRQMQMYQRGLPDLTSGLTDTFFITVSKASEFNIALSSAGGLQRLLLSCPSFFLAQAVKNMESILKADRAVVYWHQVGCIHLDDGPEIVKPCPAHAICGWVPNIFARRLGVTQSIGQLAPLCPRDVNYLPRVPRTLAPAGLPGS